MTHHYTIDVLIDDSWQSQEMDFTSPDKANYYCRGLTCPSKVVEHRTELPYEHYWAVCIDQWHGPVGAVGSVRGESFAEFRYRLGQEYPGAGFHPIETRTCYPRGSFGRGLEISAAT